MKIIKYDCILPTGSIIFLGVNFWIQKLCSCKRKWKYQAWLHFTNWGQTRQHSSARLSPQTLLMYNCFPSLASINILFKTNFAKNSQRRFLLAYSQICNVKNRGGHVYKWVSFCWAGILAFSCQICSSSKSPFFLLQKEPLCNQIW